MAKENWTAHEIILLATVMLINVVDGVDNQLLPLSLAMIGEDWGLSAGSFSAAMSAGFAGQALGTPIGGWLGDRWGRKQAILTGVTVFGLMTIVMGLCRNPEELFVARLIGGIGYGAVLAPMLAMVVEGVSPGKRGPAVALTMLSMPLGITLAGVAVPRLNLLWDWNTTFVLCGAAVFVVAAIGYLSFPSRGNIAMSNSANTVQIDLPQTMKKLFGRAGIGITAPIAIGMCLAYTVMAIGLSWLPSFAHDHVSSPIVAGQAIAFWSFAGMAGTLVAGAAVSRFGEMRATRIIIGGLLVATLGSALALAGFGPSDAMLYAAAATTGLFSNASITVLFSAASSSFAEDVRSSGIAVVSLGGKAGGMIGGASGFLVLLMSSLSGFFALLGGVAFVALVTVVIGFRRQSGSQ